MGASEHCKETFVVPNGMWPQAVNHNHNPYTPTLRAATPPPNTAPTGKVGKRHHQTHRHRAEGVGEVFPSGSIKEGFPQEGASGHSTPGGQVRQHCHRPTLQRPLVLIC